jgi:hypothetical protein
VIDGTKETSEGTGQKPEGSTQDRRFSSAGERKERRERE